MPRTATACGGPAPARPIPAPALRCPKPAPVAPAGSSLARYRSRVGLARRGLDSYGEPPYILPMRSAAPRRGSLSSTRGGSARGAKPSVQRKAARMELRLTVSSKKMIDRAVALSGLAAGDLAYEAARRIVEDHDRFVLRDADREAFLEAVAKSPAPAGRLIAALARHRRQAK